jgi:hypothetical protein
LSLFLGKSAQKWRKRQEYLKGLFRKKSAKTRFTLEVLKGRQEYLKTLAPKARF